MNDSFNKKEAQPERGDHVSEVSKEQNQKLRELKDLTEIPKWAQRYVQSKTMPMVVASLFLLGLVVAVFFSVYGFLHKRLLFGSIMMGLYIVGFVCLFLVERFSLACCYAKDGLSKNESMEQMKKVLVAPVLLLTFLCVILEQRGVFPDYLRLPVSALFICPLLVFANWRWIPNSFIGYLWAGLYGPWAVAVLFRVPLLTFPERWAGFEIALAMPLTGLVAGLIVHIYNRHALRKLKRLASVKQNDSTMEPETNR